MDKIRFGIIGCGRIARKAFLPALRLYEGAELVAVASRSREKAEEFTSIFGGEAVEGYNLLLERDDIDAVYIATPISIHAELALAAAEKGKHILCEKSLACNVDDVERILLACEERGVAILEGFMYQFHPQHSMVRKLVDAGEIGEPRLFNAWFGFPPVDSSSIQYRRDLGGGVLLETGAYTIHSARNFFKSEPSVCGAVLDCRGHEVEIHGAALLDFDEGKTATVAFGFNNFYRNTYSIWGAQGVITLTRAFSVPADFAPTLIIERGTKHIEKTISPNNQFYGEIEAFCNGLSDGRMRCLWRRDALGQARVLESIRLAATVAHNYRNKN